MAPAVLSRATPIAVPLAELDAPLAGARGPQAAPVHLPGLALTPGRVTAEMLESLASRAFGCIVVSGLIVRDVRVGDSVAAELFGPTDLLGALDRHDAVLRSEGTWSVAAPTRVVVLDGRLVETFRAAPELGARLLARTSRQTARMTVHRAISQLPRVEDRLLALFSLLAERWGRVTPAGVVVPLTLTHEALGRLVGARRPTVTLGLQVLAHDGTLGRREDGAWVLRPAATEHLALAAPPPSTSGVVPERRAATPPAPPLPPDALDLQALRERVDALTLAHPLRRDAIAATLARSAKTRAEVRVRRESRRSPRVRRPSAP